MKSAQKFWNLNLHIIAYLAATGILLSFAFGWIRAGDSMMLSAMQTAQLFMGSFAWLILFLAIAGLITVLLPFHNMRRLSQALSIGVFPAWMLIGAVILIGVQHNSMSLGFYLAGLSSALLSACALSELLGHKPVVSARS